MCLTAAALMPAGLCKPPEYPEPPAPRVVQVDRPYGPAEEPGVPEPWASLAVCESGMGGEARWDVNTGNGYSGGLQFHPRTWSAFGGGEFAPAAHQATPAEQVAVAERVLAEQGWGAWPSCSRQLGLR